MYFFSFLFYFKVYLTYHIFYISSGLLLQKLLKGFWSVCLDRVGMKNKPPKKMAFFDCCKGKEKDSFLVIDAKLSPLGTYDLWHQVRWLANTFSAHLGFFIFDLLYWSNVKSFGVWHNDLQQGSFTITFVTYYVCSTECHSFSAGLSQVL